MNNEYTFEMLCEYSDNLKIDNIEEETSSKSVQQKEQVKSNVLVYTNYNEVSINTKNEVNDIIFKVKKMSTNQLKSIFRSNRKHEPSSFYDRQLLISVVVEILLSDTNYNEEISKRTFSVSLLDKIETTKLSWENVKEIRRLYNIKQVGSKDSCYGFKEIGDLYNLSHIFTRNICLGKVYKEKS